MKKNYKLLAIFILVPLLLGTIVGLVTVPGSNVESIIPPWIFPVVWTILYILMGISSYIIYKKTGEISKIYVIQLLVNLFWSFIFFVFKQKISALIVIIVLIVLVALMIKEFLEKDKTAGYLQIPYLIWLGVAFILNLLLII